MTKKEMQERIAALEKQISDLQMQVSALALRPTYVYLPTAPLANPFSPWPPTTVYQQHQNMQ
jgi:hypothetical protein